MNTRLVRFHLGEAREQIDKTLRDINADSEYDDSEYWVAMQHLYHHVNTAWNARHATDAEAEPVSAADFRRWSQFPSDLPMME